MGAVLEKCFKKFKPPKEQEGKITVVRRERQRNHSEVAGAFWNNPQ